MEEQNHFVWLQKAELRPTVGIYKVTNVESFLKKGGGGFFSNSVIPEITSCWNNFSAVSSLTLAVFKQRLTTTCQECCRGDSGLKRDLVNVDDYQVSSNWRTVCFTPSRANWDEKMEDFRASV